jgi:hypothetical protein
MKKIVYGFFLHFFVFSLCYSMAITIANDDSTTKTPDYKSVNVLIETEWSGPEKINNVDVFVVYENNVPIKLDIFGKNNHCEIRIISGMSVKIINANTGKVLAQIKGPEEPKQK